VLHLNKKVIDIPPSTPFITSSMASPLTVQTIQGVPFWTDPQNILYVYKSSPPVRVGTWNPTTKEFSLDDDWETSAAPHLLQYRQSLGELTETLLEESNRAAAAAKK
jgi:hypothetical protein